MRPVVRVFAVVLCAMTAPAFAELLVDGKEPLICASVEAMNCERGEAGEKGLPEGIGAPQFMWIDFGKKEVIGPKRTSSIRQMDIDDTQIMLQGFELGMGWTMAIDRVTGTTSMTLVHRDGAFVVFGACTDQSWSK